MDDSTTEWWIATIHEKNDEIDRLRGLLCRVINELGDPMGGYWCERPESDRRLLEALLDDLVEEMGLNT